MHAFQMMSEPVRRRIVEILASGEHSSGEIAALVTSEFGVGRSAVGRHLATLREANWVRVRADYNVRYYQLREEAIVSLRHEVAWFEYLWERRIGEAARNDPQPHHAEQYLPGGPRPRSHDPLYEPIGTRKGMRAPGRRLDPWAP